MANNRMYLVNERTGTRVYLAKYYPSTGWYPPDDVAQRLTDAFDIADFGHLSDAERVENAIHHGLGGVPHKSLGGMYGDRWRVEYETEPSR